MAAVWCLSLIGVLTSVLPSDRTVHHADRDSWGMVVIADWPFGLFRAIPYGDADRDGRREFYACIYGEPYPNYAVEYVPENQFDSTYLGDYYWAQCLGDIDRDGLADLVTEKTATGPTVWVFESRDSFSLPLTGVWCESIPYQPSDCFATITDLDADSAREITLFHEHLPHSIQVFECNGDNDYSLSATIACPDGQMIPTQTFDMDQDGMPELAIGCQGGCVAFYEAVGGDSFAFRDTVRIARSDINSCFDVVAAARDMDHDGRTELLAPCVAFDYGLLTLAVLESSADDSLAVVWSEQTDEVSYSFGVSIGDIHGDSTLEFAFVTGASVRLYRCTGDDRYECFWWSDSGYWRAVLCDINSDGRDELIHNSHGRTIIREWLPVGVEERTTEALRGVEVQPSVVRSGGAVRVSGLPPSSEIEVVDASGRIVAACSSGDSSFVLGTLDLKAGAYFLRISSSSGTTTRPLVVLGGR